MHPRVTIGIPVYNGGRYLAAAIESILAQTLGDFELIVADNASGDETAAIGWRYAARDPRVRYVCADVNRGAAWNYNHTVDLARGRYFKWHAHDDLIEPGFLDQAVGVLERRPEVVLVYGRARLIDADGAPLADIEDRLDLPDDTPHARLARMLANANMCNPIAGLVRLDALRRTRRIDRFFGSDYVLLAELAMLGRFHELPERLFLRRIHDGSFQRANTGSRALRRWLDPRLRGGSYFPGARLNIEFLRSVWRLDLPPAERLACAWAVHRWPRARLRDTLGRWRASLRAWLLLHSSS